MFNYQVAIYENNAWNTLKSVALPITDGDVLDETLAEGKIDIKNTLRDKSIKPFTRLRIKCYDGETYKGKIQRVVGTTKKTKKRLVGTPTYDFDIQTLELTKIMERIVIGSMTSTKYIGKQYTSKYEASATSTYTETGAGGIKHEHTYSGLHDYGGAFFIEGNPTYLLYNPIGTTISSDASFITKSSSLPYDWNEQPHITLYYNGQEQNGYTLSRVGQYKIKATARYLSETTIGSVYIDIEWTIYAYSDKQAKGKTITSIVERLLSAGKTRRRNENPLITFNAEQATKYSQAPYDNPPEFAFTNSTLLDALMQIGGAIHAIPRLQCVGESENSNDLTYEVVFDELGGNEDITANMPAMVYEDKSYDITDYCGTLDSPAQNLVNSQNPEKGAMSEFGSQDITVRTENTQVEISADTMAVSLSLPIQQLVEMWCLYNGKEYNITPYVYESAEYATLSTLENSTYPYSIGYALCYTKGRNTITGLNSKITTATVLTKWKEQYAIINILRAITGDNTISMSSTEFVNLAFRVVYVPIVEARVLQKKPIAGDDDDITLIYNQGANLVETSAYGQKMRGAAARLGQEITRRTYDFFGFDNLPKVGQIIDGAYIAQVDCAYYINKIRATVTLTPNFNLLSQYVGLNTNYRLSDISTEQITDRFITYGNKLIFGNYEEIGVPIIPLQGSLYSVEAMLNGNNNNDIRRISTALFIGYQDGENNDIEQIADSQVLLPVMSFPFGTSWAFVCACLDNYGAGYQATDAFDTGTAPDSVHKRAQRLVPYSDAVGEMQYLGVWWSGQEMWTNADEVGDGKQANLYPYATNNVVGKYQGTDGAIIKDLELNMTTGAYPFILEKDSKERIGVVYQMHLQANRDSIVIGSALADNCPLCTNYTANAGTAYVLPHTINTFGSVDLTGATQTTFSINNGTGSIKVANPGIAGTKAWVIVDTNNNIYIGENTSENVGGFFPTIYISTK